MCKAVTQLHEAAFCCTMYVELGFRKTAYLLRLGPVRFMYLWLQKPLAGVLASLLVFTTISATAQKKKTSETADQKLSYAYILTMDKVNKLEDVREALGEWLENHERSSRRINEDRLLIGGTIADRTRLLDTRHPDVAAVIRRHGISTLQYLLGSQVLYKTFKLVMARRTGEIQDYSNAGAAVNPANLAFVEQHFEEIRKKMGQGLRTRS
jgi:hypothetical protein